MKVIKNYGVVAEHGNKELRLQTILDANKEKRLALVSYKDGMSFKTTDITEEAKELKRLLEEYLGYKKESEADSVVNTLTTLPANDCNYKSALENADINALKKAIKIMQKNGGKNATHIKSCESELSKKENGDNTVQFPANKTTTAKANENGQKAKVYQFPNKKPDIIKLDKIDKQFTYEECEAKLREEGKVFIDSDSQYVIEGLLELCKVDADFRSNVMREDKSYGGFMEFMFQKTKEGYCITYGNVRWLDRDLGLGLAIDYYNADTEKMEEERKAKEEAERKAKKEANADGKKTTKGRKKKNG